MASHDHPHHHAHGPTRGRAFAVSVALNLGFVVVETFGGILAGSVALLADAAHNAGDIAGLLLAWGATWLAGRRPTQRYTYGYRKATILAALGNAMLILVAVGGVAWEAVRRLDAPPSVEATLVIWVAALGILINGASAAMFWRQSKHDVNMRGAFVHLASDAAVSLGVVISGAIVLFTGWNWLDPLVTLLVCVVIVLGAWGLLRDSFQLALDGAPAHLSVAQISERLGSIDGVDQVHDLHVWAMSTEAPALTAHLVVSGDPSLVLGEARRTLEQAFDIHHSTLQIERTDACEQACGDDRTEGDGHSHAHHGHTHV